MKNQVIIKALLTAAVTVGMALPATAYDFKVDGLCYNIIEGTTNVEVTFEVEESPRYTSTIENLVIPEVVTFEGTEYNVKAIGDNAFCDCSDIKGNLVIPNSITSIGGSAFYNCTGLTGELTIPNSITSIGRSAFYNCSGLTGELTIPNSVTSIGRFAFYNCSGFIGDLTIPESITIIEKSTFSCCSGFSGNLTIPNTVTSIGTQAFINCSGLTGDLTIPNSVTTIGDGAFYDCIGFSGNLSLSAAVSSIGEHVFRGCSGLIGNLEIPNSVTTIGKYAFFGCSGFTGGLTMPNTITSISEGVFANCSGLTGNLDIPNSVTTIERYAFANCSGLTGDITLSDNLTSIAEYSFSGCYMASVVIPKSITSIASNAFDNCTKLKNIYCYNLDPTSINEVSFSGLTKSSCTLHVPYGMAELYQANDSWKDFVIVEDLMNEDVPSKNYTIVYKINSGTDNTATVSVVRNTDTNVIEKIVIPEKASISGQIYTITGIANGALQSTKFEDVVIPRTITNLASQICEGRPGTCYNGCRTFNTLYYNAISVEAVEGPFAPNFQNLVIGDEVEDIPSTLTYGYYHTITYSATPSIYTHRAGNALIQSLSFPNSVKTIGKEAFRECGVKEVTFGDHVRSIYNSAFYRCENLENVKFPGSIYEIGNSAFYNCSSLQSIEFSRTNGTIIGGQAFEGCSSCKTIILSRNIFSIGSRAFYNCKALEEVYNYCPIPVNIDDNTFYNKPSGAVLHVLKGSADLFKAATGWKSFIIVDDLEADDASTIINTGTPFHKLGLDVSVGLVNEVVTVPLRVISTDDVSALSFTVALPERVLPVDDVDSFVEAGENGSGFTFEAVENADGTITVSGAANEPLAAGESVVLNLKVKSQWQNTYTIPVTNVTLTTADDEVKSLPDGITTLVLQGMRGDMNGDGRVDSSDAIYIYHMIGGLAE